MSSFNNQQTVIITGGATGIGFAVAEQFLERDANVVLNGRTESKLRAAAERLRTPDRVAIVAGDITQPETAGRIVDEAVAKFRRTRRIPRKHTARMPVPCFRFPA